MVRQCWNVRKQLAVDRTHNTFIKKACNTEGADRHSSHVRRKSGKRLTVRVPADAVAEAVALAQEPAGPHHVRRVFGPGQVARVAPLV